MRLEIAHAMLPGQHYVADGLLDFFEVTARPCPRARPLRLSFGSFGGIVLQDSCVTLS